MAKKTGPTGGRAKHPAAIEKSSGTAAQDLVASRARVLALFGSASYAELAELAASSIERYPADAFFRKALGVARGLMGERGDRVIEPLTEAVRLQPGDAESHDALALALARVGRLDEALLSGQRAIELAPAHPVLLTNYGNLLAEAHRYEDALTCHRRAVQLDPGLVEGWNNLGSALRSLPWRHGEAAAALHRAIELNPNYQAAWDNLLYLRQFQSEPTPVDILREALAGAEQLSLSVRPRPRAAARPLAGRRLRVGWVSADLRLHTVGNALLAVLPHFSTQAVEIFAYSNSPHRDQVTAQIAQRVSQWREVSALSDEALTDLVAEDRIDVLVDLSGRTRGNRLGVFARRAAPVQVSWLGWFSTTGLPQMDWYLADRVTLPVLEQSCFAERCWAIEGPYYLQQRDLATALPAPDGYTGSIRFACFNNLSKVSTRSFDLWAKILVALPAASLTLKSRELVSAEVCAGVRQEFVRRGVAGSRLVLEASTTLVAYLQSFNQVDLCLDPSPFTGGATSFDSLLMGVPVLTLKGDRLLTHQGENLLLRLGLEQWIAADEASYVAKAIAAAAAVDDLRAGRIERHRHYLASPLVDGAQLAAQLAEAWRAMHERALVAPPEPRLPDDPVALQRVASILLHLESWSAAQTAWRRMSMLAVDPASRADARAREAIALQGTERFAEALAGYREALPVLGPAAAYTLNLNMGVCCQQLQRHGEAIAHAEAALRAQPGDVVARRNLAAVCMESGDLDRAITLYDELRRVKPEETAYLYALNFRWPYDPIFLRDEHRKWGDQRVQHACTYYAGLPPNNSSAPAPRRLGFLSQDFRRHPVAAFCLPVLRELAVTGFELYFYSDVRQSDAVSDQFRCIGHWMDCTRDDDRALSARIRADRIDVLCDLGGITGSRPAFLAGRHAPVQLSWLGYCATSGLSTVDALLTDSALDPPGVSESHYVEPLVRLDPSFVTYDNFSALPDLSPLSSAAGRPFTFGSFNKPSKLNRATIRLWGAVLSAVPESRMLVVGAGLARPDSAIRKRLTAWLHAEGVATARIEWRDQQGYVEYLDLYREVDVALDCVPWSGHTVTLDAAWMGVPTLAFGGRHHAGRLSLATMRLLGLDEFCVELGDAIDAAVLGRVAEVAGALAARSACDSLIELKKGLRERIRRSALGAPELLAKRLTDVLLELWRQRS